MNIQVEYDRALKRKAKRQEREEMRNQRKEQKRKDYESKLKYKFQGVSTEALEWKVERRQRLDDSTDSIFGIWAIVFIGSTFVGFAFNLEAAFWVTVICFFIFSVALIFGCVIPSQILDELDRRKHQTQEDPDGIN